MSLLELITDDITATVLSHPWKVGSRSRPVNAIIWHFTGSGQQYGAEKEYQATLNWFRSPNNRTADGYAGISNLVVGPGKVCLAVPLDRMPRFSSWASDEHAISVEVAHSYRGQPWDMEVIRTCQRVGAALRAMYGIPQKRVIPADLTSDLTWDGEAGHEDTWQGRVQGKTDPGAEFWALYMTPEEEPMTPEERARLERLEKLVAGNGYRSPGGLLTGEEAMAAAAADGGSLFLGLGLLQEEVANLPTQPGKVAPHAHKSTVTLATSREIIE